MRRLIQLINNRNELLPTDLISLKEELQLVFNKNLLSAGVLQPGYFNDFHNVLQKCRNNGQISRYMITEEEYTEDGNFYKIPVIDIVKNNEQSNIRIFLLPV
jgi:hypothetical protein